MNESKFSSWAGSHGSYKPANVTTSPYKTDKMLSGCFTTEELIHNKKMLKKLSELNKSNVVKGKSQSAGYDPRLTKSTSTESFFNQRSWVNALKERCTLENLIKGFNDFITDESSFITNTQQRGYIHHRNIRKALYAALGDDIPEFIIDKFEILCRRELREDLLAWVDLRIIYPKAIEALEAECSAKTGLPALVVLMNRPRLADKNLKFIDNLSSTYQDTFCSNDDNYFSDDILATSGCTISNKNNNMEMDNRPPLSASAKVLCAGSIKGTFQLPGYKGHIPTNVRNDRKLLHSRGEVPHPVVNNLRLTQRGMGCVLGYTGHVPKEVEGEFKERTTACDPKTTSGASYGPVRAYL
eukprot:gene10114-13593_t